MRARSVILIGALIVWLTALSGSCSPAKQDIYLILPAEPQSMPIHQEQSIWAA